MNEQNQGGKSTKEVKSMQVQVILPLLNDDSQLRIRNGKLSRSPRPECDFTEVGMQELRMGRAYFLINFFNIICDKPEFGVMLFCQGGIFKKIDT